MAVITIENTTHISQVGNIQQTKQQTFQRKTTGNTLSNTITDKSVATDNITALQHLTLDNTIDDNRHYNRICGVTCLEL